MYIYISYMFVIIHGCMHILIVVGLHSQGQADPAALHADSRQGAPHRLRHSPIRTIL